MERPHLIKDPEKRRRVAHLVAAATILVHAYENYETGHHSWQLFALAGSVVLVLAIFHHTIEKRIHWIDGVFFVIEGMLSFVVSFDDFHHGKKALPITFLCLGIFQFYMAYKRGKKGMVKSHK
ncbi:hypothetical protein BH11BAC7_BH11BAC7_37030 [soil metagenome]